MSGKNPLGNGKEPQAYEGLNIIVPVGGWRLVRSTRSPTSNDTKYPIGSMWINTSNNTAWLLTSNPGTWSEFAASVAGAIISITGNSGGAILPAAGNINILGGTNATVSGAGSTLTINLVAPFDPTTLTNHGILLGSGAASIRALAVGTTGQLLSGATGADPAFLTAGTNGQLLVGSTGAQPAFATVTTATGVNFTTGAGTLAIDVKTDGMAVVNQNTNSAALAAQTMYVTNNGSILVTYTLPATVAQGTTIKIIGSSLGGWRIAQNAGQTINLGSQVTTSGTGGSVSSTNKFDCVELTAIDATTNVWVINNSTGSLTFV